MSLAARLLPQRPAMRLVIVEPGTDYQEDRTWCGWRLAPHFLEDCAVPEWNQGRIGGRGRTPLLKQSSYPYEVIRATLFYDKAEGLVERSAKASLLLGVEAGPPTEAVDRVKVPLADGTVLRSRYVIDARPQLEFCRSPGYVRTLSDKLLRLILPPAGWRHADPDGLPGCRPGCCALHVRAAMGGTAPLRVHQLLTATRWVFATRPGTGRMAQPACRSGWRLLRRESG